MPKRDAGADAAEADDEGVARGHFADRDIRAVRGIMPPHQVFQLNEW
jgi:hypothetical protein